jgi:hypothetical protein
VNKFLCILPVAAGLATAVAGYVVGGHWIVAVMFAAFATFFVGVHLSSPLNLIDVQVEGDELSQ